MCKAANPVYGFKRIVNTLLKLFDEQAVGCCIVRCHTQDLQRRTQNRKLAVFQNNILTYTILPFVQSGILLIFP